MPHAAFDLEPADAERLLADLAERGLVELDSPSSVRGLAPGLADFLEHQPRPLRRGTDLAEWLLDQDGVSELLAEDQELAEAVEKFLSSVPPPPSAVPHGFQNVLEAEGRWAGTMHVNVGIRDPFPVRVELDAPPTEACIARLAKVREFLRGSWGGTLAPALAERFPPLVDEPEAAQALLSLTVYLGDAAPRWSAQLTFDFPLFRDTGFFLDFEGRRVVDGCAVE